MFRRFAATALCASSVLTACGHDVTPLPTIANSDLAGHVTVKFQTNGPLDFNNVTYVIAIDMCGNGVPYPMALVSGYKSYTFAFFIGGGFANTALPRLFQFYLNPSNPGTLTEIPIYNLNPSSTQFTANYNDQSSEFAFTFLRSDLNNPFNVALPCPDSTAQPTGSGDDGTGVSIPPFQAKWVINLLTFPAGGGKPYDSLGVDGPVDVSFSGITVDTTQTTSSYFFRPQPNAIPQLPAAYITYGEVDTYAL